MNMQIRKDPSTKNHFRKNYFATMLASAAILAPLTAHSVQEADVLPDAKPGECYGKVLVPPSYKTETFESVVSEATENVLVIPAKFADDKQTVMLKEASTNITITEAEYETTEQSIVVLPESTQWVRDSIDSKQAASNGELADLGTSGVDLDDAKIGSCYFEHYIPAKVEKTVEKILISEATETLEVVPASFTSGKKDVLLQPSSQRFVSIPARIKTVQEKVLVEPAKSVWKKGNGLVQKIDNLTGEIMCRVEIPAVYKEFPKNVVEAPPRVTAIPVPAQTKTLDIELLATDASEKRTPVDAVYETVDTFQTVGEASYSWAEGAPGDETVLGEHTGRVLCHKQNSEVVKKFPQTLVKNPGTFEAQEVPAVFEEVPTKNLITAAMVNRTPVLEEKESFTKTIKVADARLEWRPVLCETNLSTDTISAIQKALGDEGYEAGKTSGVIDQETFSALEKFQKDKNLAQGGLTFTTLEALGIEL